MAEPILTERALNRALLERQLLLERAPLSIEAAVEQIGGLQTQYAPSGYVGLWTRLAGFRRDDLTRALEDRLVVQGTLIRATIHIVSRREYWLYTAGVREARRAWLRRLSRPREEAAMLASAAELTGLLAGRPREAKDLGAFGSGFLGRLGIWVDLVRVPPSGTWERRRADRLALATSWVGPDGATAGEGLVHLVRAYLRAFGPAPWRDIAAWAGISAADARRGGSSLELRPYRDEAGRELIDLAGLTLPDPDTPAPVRFLPHWDSALLAHARRAGVLPEPHRLRVFSSRNPFSVGTYLVDGRVAGAWSIRAGRVALDPYVDLSPADRREVDLEREALEAFHA